MHFKFAWHLLVAFSLCALTLAAPANVRSVDGASPVSEDGVSIGKGLVLLECLTIAL